MGVWPLFFLNTFGKLYADFRKFIKNIGNNFAILGNLCIFAANFKASIKMKEIFVIIQALCRASLTSNLEVTEFQIGRLVPALEKAGYQKEAASISRLLQSVSKQQQAHPVSLQLASSLSGEPLTSKVPIPTDKETGAPLLEVIFPEQLPLTAPIFDDEIKDAVNSVILEWTNYAKLSELQAAPSRSCLIYGEPGTGKTHLAKWMARKVGLPIVLARLDGIVSSFLGTSARNIRSLFNFANKYKCILLLDEFDAIAKLRDDPQEVGEVKRIVNSLLQNLDERNECGFTIGVTNHERLLDPAVWRRFDVQIEIPRPSERVIPELLSSFITPMTLSEGEVGFLSWCLQGTSGADIQKLSNWMKRMSVIPEYKDSSLVDNMRRYTILNTERICAEVKHDLEKSNDELIKILTERDMKKKDIAELFGMSASSLSKTISKTAKA